MFICHLLTFFKINIKKNLLGSKILDQNYACRFVRPDLYLNCLQGLIWIQTVCKVTQRRATGK